MESSAKHSDMKSPVLTPVSATSKSPSETTGIQDASTTSEITAIPETADASGSFAPEKSLGMQHGPEKSASLSQCETASQTRSSRLSFVNWGSSLFSWSRVSSPFSSVSQVAASSFSPSTVAPSSTLAADVNSSSSTSSETSLNTINNFNEKDCECVFFDSPFSAADSRYYPSDGSPQHAVFRNSQGLRLHAYFWFPSNTDRQGAGDSHRESGRGCKPRYTNVSLPASDTANAGALSTDLCIVEQQGKSQQNEIAQHQPQEGEEPQQQHDAAQQQQADTQQQQKARWHEGDETGQQRQQEEGKDLRTEAETELEYQRACDAASCRGIIVVLHGYCGHGRLAYLKKIPPKDYVRQHPSWGTYTTASSSSSSFTPSSAFFSLVRPVEKKKSSNSTQQSGTAAAALAEALAPCDISFFQQHASDCLSQRYPVAAVGPADGFAEAATAPASKNCFAAAETDPEDGFPTPAPATAEEMPEQAAAIVREKQSSVTVRAAARGEKENNTTGAASSEQETCTSAKAIALTAVHVGKAAGARAGDIRPTEEEHSGERGRDDVTKRKEKTQQHEMRDNCSETPIEKLYSGSWVEAFNKAGYIVAALDMQGHGLSEGWEGKPATVRCFDDFAVDVVQFLYIARKHCRRLRAIYELQQKQQQKKQQQQKEQHQKQQQQQRQQEQDQQQEEKQEQAPEQQHKYAQQWNQLGEGGKEGEERRVHDEEEVLQESGAAFIVNARHFAEAQSRQGEAKPAKEEDAAVRDAAAVYVDIKEEREIAKRDAAAVAGSEEGETRDAAEQFGREDETAAEEEEEKKRKTDDPPFFLMGLSLGGAVALRTVQLLCEAVTADPTSASHLPEREDEDGWEEKRKATEGIGEERPEKKEEKEGLAKERGSMEDKHACFGSDNLECCFSRFPTAGACPVHGRSEKQKKKDTEEARYSCGTEDEDFLRLSGCILLSPMLDLETARSAGQQYCHFIVKPALRMLKKWIPHVVVTGAHAYVKYPFQQEMMMEDPYTYKGGVRVAMAYEMINATEQLLSQQRLDIMQQPRTRCPSLLLVQNIFDTTCGFRGCLKLFHRLSLLHDKTLLLLNAFVGNNNTRDLEVHRKDPNSSSRSDDNSNAADTRVQFNNSIIGVSTSNGEVSTSRDEVGNSRGEVGTGKAYSSSSRAAASNISENSGGTSVKCVAADDDTGCHAYVCDAESRAAGAAPVRELGHEATCVYTDDHMTDGVAGTIISHGISSERAAANNRPAILKSEETDKSSSTGDTVGVSETSSMRSWRAETSSVNDTAATAEENSRSSSRHLKTTGLNINIRMSLSDTPLLENTDKCSNFHDAVHNSGNDIDHRNIDDKDVSTEEMAYEVFLRSFPKTFNLDYATLKALQIYADPDLNELDVFHSFPSDPEEEKVLKRVMLWVLQRSPSKTRTDTAIVST